MEERDFFLMKPAPGLEACRPRLARYTDAMACSQALFRHLRVPDWDTVEKGWRPGGADSTFERGSEGYWTEHSARATMASWAAAAGLPPDVLRRMGRWKGDVAASYVRTDQTLVMEVQKRIAEVIKNGDLNEEGIQLHFDTWCVAQGVCKLNLAFKRSTSSLSGAQVSVMPDVSEDDADEGDVPEGPCPQLGDYVVSVVGTKGFKRLHRV
eukprot:6469204-Amphidinium_carterae.1